MMDRYLDVLSKSISILQSLAREQKSFDLMSGVSALSEIYADTKYVSKPLNIDKVNEVVKDLSKIKLSRDASSRLNEALNPLITPKEGGIPPQVLQYGAQVGRQLQTAARNLAKDVVNVVSQKLEGKSANTNTGIPVVNATLGSITDVVRPLTIGKDEDSIDGSIELDLDAPSPDVSEELELLEIDVEGLMLVPGSDNGELDDDLTPINDSPYHDVDWAYTLGNIEGGDPDSLCETNLRPALSRLSKIVPKILAYISQQAINYSTGFDTTTRFTETNDVSQFYFTLSSVPMYTCTASGDSLPQMLDLLFVVYFALNEIDERCVVKNMISSAGIDDLEYSDKVLMARIKHKQTIYDLLKAIYDRYCEMPDDAYLTKDTTRDYMQQCDKSASDLESAIDAFNYLIDPKQNMTCIKTLIKFGRAVNANVRAALDYIGGDLTDPKGNVEKMVRKLIVNVR